ncbi:MAG: cellulose 1,4-beta-cellobiosidase [Ruminococcus sp.]|nr:cellulose 1,4-beta-cellobiosidase [Ruminococcus sp.]
MISKKNKALVAGILTAAMSATAVVPAFASAAPEPNSYAKENDANTSYAKMFESLYDDVITNGEKNGYLSKNNNGSGSFGIPYHSVETLVIEAPDYGHETTSEAMSYIAWITAMHDVLADKGRINGSTGDLAKGWKTLEAMIPGWSKNAYGSSTKYETLFTQTRLKADTTTEENDPSKYPAKKNNVDGYNPLFEQMQQSYKGDKGYYMMHWLADVEDWYGFGGGKGQFTFINTFQRGEQESCFETVPHGCIEELKYGMDYESGNGNYKKTGIKAVFNGWKGEGDVSPQYGFTNAPDAEDRAIQAIFFANQFGLAGGKDLSDEAGKMGDQCRNDMFDKYYKAIGCQDIGSASAGFDSQHFLMAWYTAWGGSTLPWYSTEGYDWAYQIGCSHSHQFYQNPLAAYALAFDPAISAGMGGSSSSNRTKAIEDYKESFKRQIEFYLWLQSANGPFAGGCSNSKNGQYEKYDSSEATFYDMVYVPHPVYADPGSNHWIGNQVWSTQRLAELYYYVKTNNSDVTGITGDATGGMTFGGMDLETALETILGKWIDWFLDEVKWNIADENGNIMEYAIPANLDWDGQPGTNWTENSTYSDGTNSGLTCTVRNYGMGDIGCVSSLCNTLILYAAATETPGSAAQDDNGTTRGAKALRTANKLMTAQWNLGRDDIGIAYEGNNGSYTRIFDQVVYIPDGFEGEMPDGSKLLDGNRSTFSSIREKYAEDEMWQACKAVYDSTGATDDYMFTVHRFWHMGDALMTTGMMALLYPDVEPDGAEAVTDPQEVLWGDANVDGKVDLQDAVAILQYAALPAKYPLTDQGLLNADVVDNGTSGVNGIDALSIQMYDAKLITQKDWPISKADQDAKIK